MTLDLDLEARSVALVVLDPILCPECSATLYETAFEEPALFRFGGYGATRRTEHSICFECGWLLLRSISEVRPCT